MPEPDGPQWNRPPSPFTAVSGQDEVWDRIMGRDGVVYAATDAEGHFLADPSEEYDEPVSRCGYCGEAIDYCQGHGEDERAEYGFESDSAEYDARREFFEDSDAFGSSSFMPGSLDFLRHGNTTGGPTPEGARWEAPTHSGLAADEFTYQDENTRGPDYDEPDPFDRSNPVEARQAKAIEDMNKLWEE